MVIFKKTNYKNINYKGFYSYEYFNKRLIEEKRRSERTGNPFSILCINIDGVNNCKRKKKENAERTKKYISNLINDNCRTTDIKAWVSEMMIKIILPETSYTDAQLFKKKIIKKFNNGQKIINESDDKYNLNEKIEVTTFPEAIRKEKGNNDKLMRCGLKKVNGKIPAKITATQKKYRKIILAGNGQGNVVEPLYEDVIIKKNMNAVNRKIKRIIDVICALIGCILLMPIMIMIALAIKTTSKGPIIFKQSRVGIFGKVFVFYKFRTMYHGCDEEKHVEYVTAMIKNNSEMIIGDCSENVFKMQNDTRITRVGRFLRKTSLDELPQLINVLKGDMSIVGPRPPTTYEVKNYENWHLRRVMEVMPGITGLWQVEGRSATNFNDMVRMDMMYIKKFSIWMDIKIIFKTCLIVFTGKGAY